MVVVSF
jgi:hypothetical protein